jgi:hypothetical protein
VIPMPPSRKNPRRQKQAGYSLMMVIFMVATMMLLVSTAALRIDTQGRREREKELAWRGEQYQRAIGLYFRKFGRYPTKVDDLVKQTNGIRFLRQAYTDPMNKDDGSWRFIYYGPGGQLIGSLRRTSLLQGVVSTPTMPGIPGASPIGAGIIPGQTGQQSNNGLSSQPQSLQGAVIGGNIIGVASKVKDASLRIYEGGDTYELWEFIWNPGQQVAIPGGGGPGTNPGGPNGPGPTTAPGVPIPIAPGQPGPGTGDPQGGPPQQ